MIPADPYGQALTVGSVPAMHAASPLTRDKVAVTEGERRLTWRQLDERSTRAAAALIRYGVRPGDPVATDEPVAELETDKITLEVYAPVAGTFSEILAEEGANVPVGAVLGRIEEGIPSTEAPHPPAEAGPSLSPLTRGEGL